MLRSTSSTLLLVALLTGPAAALSSCSSDDETPSRQDAGADAAAPPADAGDAAVAECPPPGATPTVHEGDVRDTQTWTAAQSPHVVRGDLNVREGGRLVIEPCAVVRLAANATINVAYPLTPNTGELVAEGTAGRPIRFEGLDGARWGSIFVHGPGRASLAHATLVGGGASDVDGGATLLAYGDGELPSDPILRVDHVVVDGSGGFGVKLSRAASFTTDSSDLTIRGSGSEEHPYPLSIGEQAIDSVPTGTYTGNRADEILIDTEVVSGAGGVLESATMRNRGVPYRVGTSPGLDDLSVGNREEGPPVVLTIEPGVTIKLLAGSGIDLSSPSGADVPAQGVIRALGTATAPVVFTSAADTPSAGDWRGFMFHGIARAENRLENVRIEYTGADCSCGLVTCSAGVEQFDGALIFMRRPQAAFLVSSVVANASGHGVVQGWDGPAFDWTTGNAYQSVAGCMQTLPREIDGTCPDPEPVCQRGQ